MKPKTDAEKLRELREVARDFLTEIQFVPMRAVDCDQKQVDRLWLKLASLAGWRS